ncbi:universal stress protein [Rubrobacter aplysinae]|uniref:universal stress protein n=1 Tax=Rubrobacter aplysinae TaxID=909625 RepID=UPI00064C0950|nr:universal stress protein [Rubrobacter aplysinae]
MTIFPGMILVATDGNRSSESAVLAAAELSEKTGAEIHLIYVGEEITETSTPRSQGSDADVGKKAQDLLQEKSQTIDSAGGSVGRSSVVPGKNPAREIVKLTRDEGVGMVVVGSRGLGPLQYALRGSVSTYVVREAFCPVLVVRGD